VLRLKKTKTGGQIMKQRRKHKPSALSPCQAPFPYDDYVQAKNALLAALRGPCFYATVTGFSGMGKTSLLRETSSQLDRSRHQVAYLSSSQISATGIVRFLAQSLHVAPRRCLPETVQSLTEAIQVRTAHLLLWIDEAHEVQSSTLQEVRMLAEADHTTNQTFSVVLSGLPTLTNRIDAPSLFPLKRRITLRCILNGLKRSEFDPFVEHRFGTNDALRIPEAVRDDLFERTQATPALIDQVLRWALARTKGAVNADLIRSIIDTAGL
jgi:type II secretory pathway predicted ATPase ExeA